MARILIHPLVTDIVPQTGRALLLNAPAVDLRLPWARWHQPTGLLQIGAALQRQGHDVRFIDLLQPGQGGRIDRQKVGSVQVEGYDLNLWRFGLTWSHLANALKSLKEEGWTPDLVLVSCFTASWWQGAQELIRYLKAGVDGRPPLLPGVPVVLGGVYPTLEPEHAAMHTQADVVVVGSIPEARLEVPQLELYGPGRIPRFAGVYLYRSQSVADANVAGGVVPRPPEEVAGEIAHKAQLGVTEFAFFDEEVRLDQREHFLEVLDAIIERDLNVRFVALGNVSPRLIAQAGNGSVARKMGQAGYRQVHLKCEVTHRPDGPVYDTPYEVYQACAAALQREARFKPRTEQLTAMLLIGTPYEYIEAVTERLIGLASIVGSVNLVPYQYSPGAAESRIYESLIYRDNGYLNLTAMNCKLYPLARRNRIPYEHYIELTRLAALLNSKFRSTTFDFLGDGIVARAVQTSLRERAWDPFRTEERVGPGDVMLLSPMSSSGSGQASTREDE
jgi:hypothetical protein